MRGRTRRLWHIHRRKRHSRILQYKVEAVSQFKKLVKGFEAEHPNITIDIINTADAATDLRTRFVKNKVPDVLTVDGGRYFGEFAAAGIFQDFTDDEILDNINPQMVKLLKDLAKLYDTSADRAYGIPFAGNANGYVVNVDLWRQAGLDPDNLPETWSEFIAAMKQIQQAGITPIEGSLAEPWTTQAPFASLAGTLVPISEYSKLSGGTATFADLWGPVAEKEVEFYQYTQDNPGVTYQQATQDFANGKAAILPLGTYVVPQVRMVNPDINVKFAQLPATDDPDEQVLTAGDDTVLTISATTKHPKESRMFVEFLDGPRTGSRNTPNRSSASLRSRTPTPATRLCRTSSTSTRRGASLISPTTTSPRP